MNLIFRFWWMVFCARFFRPRLGIFDEGRMTFRCLPHDIDINRHMTNSRYFSFMDLGRIDFMIRNGMRALVRDAGIRSMVGSTAVRFRRGIDPFQKFTVVTRVLSWDDRWIYSLQKVLVGDEVATTALFKIAYVGSRGRVSPAEVARLVGHDAPPPPLTETLKAQNVLDDFLRAEA